MPIPTTAARRIPATGKRQVRLIAKAAKGGGDMLAVYDAAGVLQGTVPVDALQPLASPPGQAAKPSQATTDANAARVAAQSASGQQQAAADEVEKAVGPSLRTLKPRPAGEVRKAATSLNEQWTTLIKSAGPSTGAAISAGVASAALSLMISGRANSAKAASLCKRAAVQLAVNRNVI